MPKQNENGVLGEARVRSILLERFDVLNRSVDKDGADFLVQLRSSARFSDDQAPRLAIVQAKYAQDERTAHLLPVGYALDGGRSIKEFFVIVATGGVDDQGWFFLSADDLAVVPRTKRSEKEYYNLTGAARQAFAQPVVSVMPDRIEAAMVARSSEQNAAVLQTLNIPNYDFKRRSLAPEWMVSVPNEIGFVPDLVWQIRVALRAMVYGMDAVISDSAIALTAMDVRECVSAVSDVLGDHAVSEDAAGVRLAYSLDRVSQLRDDLERAVDVHSRRLALLETSGFAGEFASAQRSLSLSHREFIEAHNEPRRVRIDSSSFRISDDHVETTLRIDESKRCLGATTKLVAAGRAVNQSAGPNALTRSRPLWKFAEEGGASTWRELHRLQVQLLADYFVALFPSEVVASPKLPLVMAE